MKGRMPYSTMAVIFFILTLVLTFTLETTKFTRGVIALISLGLCLVYYFMHHYHEKEKNGEKT